MKTKKKIENKIKPEFLDPEKLAEEYYRIFRATVHTNTEDWYSMSMQSQRLLIEQMTQLLKVIVETK